MPMMKTASVGTTNITNIQRYLLKAQRQDSANHQLEWDSYAAGSIQLSEQQAGHLLDYLGQESRGLAVDVSDDLTVRNWAQQMDLTRALHQHDKAAKQGRSRSYYHFILSPNPNDECSLDTLRAYARTWCEENFRRGERLHEYAIVYHDDNEKGVLHAHVVVNVTNKLTGRKLHLDNNQTVALEVSAQDIGRRFGLTPIREHMQMTIGARTTQPIYLDQREREILSKGGYSWKWELRKFISDIAPLCKDFDDFKWKLNRAGYDAVLSEKTGYITYTHRNGAKVRDSRLGARFYLESLERAFSHESLLEDQSYSTWELIKISKGEVPWKEEIRRAIDAVTPTVMSVPELQRELDARYGIRLTVNRRGITYQHACGFKTRDVSIGLRYTLEGLRQNAVVGMGIPYPSYDSILKESGALTRHYLPRSAHGVSADAHEAAASRFVYQDITRLLVSNNLARIEDVEPMLARRRQELAQEKAELAEMRSQLMRLNHLAVLQLRYERDVAFLNGEGKGAEPSEFNDTLIRAKRIGLYLTEQAGGHDVRASQQTLHDAYESRLSRYQSQMKALDQDQTIYQNYLMGKSLVDLHGYGSEATVDTQALLAASKTLAKHRIRDFFHLSKVISSSETHLDLTQHRLSKAEARKRELDLVLSDIRTYREAKAYLPVSNVLSMRPASLNVEAQAIRFQGAAERLSRLGIDEAIFSEQETAHKQASCDYDELLKTCNEIQTTLKELKDAQRVCQRMAEFLKPSIEREAEEGKKGSSSGYGGTMIMREEREPEQLQRQHSPTADTSAKTHASELPLEEARRRRLERQQNVRNMRIPSREDLQH